MTNAIARECGIAALQLEVSTPFRVPKNIGGHTPKGEAVPFSPGQLPKEIASRRNPDPACVKATVQAIAHLANQFLGLGEQAAHTSARVPLRQSMRSGAD